METLFRRHFWVLHGVFLAVTAFLLAGAVNTGVGAVLKGSIQQGGGEVTQRAPASGGRMRNFQAATDANIFGAKREVVTEQDADAPQACASNADCGEGTCEDGICVEGSSDPKNDLMSAVPTELRVRLVGTAVFPQGEFSLASIVDESQGKAAGAGLYSMNACPTDAPPRVQASEVEGVEMPAPVTLQRVPCNKLLNVAEIRLIDADRVYLYNDTEQRFEYIQLGEEPKKGPVVSRAPPKQKSQEKSTDDLEQHIKKTGENKFEVEQAGIDKALGDLSKLATQARIVPAFEGGEAVGFKLFSIRPGSLYSKIGIQNGDVISRINGYELNSPDKALEVYQKLKDAKDISVDLKRRGKPVSLNYNVVP
jgi:hypothetical protein